MEAAKEGEFELRSVFIPGSVQTLDVLVEDKKL